MLYDLCSCINKLTLYICRIHVYTCNCIIYCITEIALSEDFPLKENFSILGGQKYFVTECYSGY